MEAIALIIQSLYFSSGICWRLSFILARIICNKFGILFG